MGPTNSGYLSVALEDGENSDGRPKGQKPWVKFLQVHRYRILVVAGVVVAIAGCIGVVVLCQSRGAPLRDLSGVSVNSCSWETENCHTTGCCRRQNFKCFERERGFGDCSEDCQTLVNASKSSWTCDILGGAPPLQWAVPSKRNAAKTSLFCMMVVTAGGLVAPGVHEGYEEELLGMMRKNKVSIFSCDEHKLYDGAKAQSGKWKSVVNTDIFVSVWKQVKSDGLYKKHDWTVKVDADAVFLPDRLKAHIVSLSPPADTPVYLHNIDFRFHFMGALEVLSSKAVDLFLQNIETCEKHIGSMGGEDLFTMQCLDSIGVAHMTDFSLLDDKYTHDPGWNMNDVNSCTDQAIVAFHPYKSANAWLGCYKVAMKIQKPADFVGCDYRWHGDACNLGGNLSHSPTDQQPTDGIMRNRA